MVSRVQDKIVNIKIAPFEQIAQTWAFSTKGLFGSPLDCELDNLRILNLFVVGCENWTIVKYDNSGWFVIHENS